MLPMRISPPIVALHTLAAIVCVLALQSSRREFSHEPNSSFFSPHSDHFQQQRRARLADIAAQTRDLTAEPQNQPTEASTIQRWSKQLCLGVLSDNDDPTQAPESLLRTLASLTIGLTADERDAIHLVVLLAANDPDAHFASKQPWLPKMADQVVVYGENKTTGTRPDGFRLVALDRGGSSRGGSRVERSRFDSATLMRVCSGTDTFYTALVEPDFVASGDWHIRLAEAVSHIDRSARIAGQDWAYLRLFHGVEPKWEMRWDKWRMWSLSWMVGYLTVVVTVVSLSLWGFHPKGFSVKAVWHVSFPLLTLVVWVPVAVWLFLQIGGSAALQHHNTGYAGGVREIGGGGCCGHGVVFPKRQLSQVEAMLRSPPYEVPMSTVLDALALQKGWSRWGMDPSLLV